MFGPITSGGALDDDDVNNWVPPRWETALDNANGWARHDVNEWAHHVLGMRLMMTYIAGPIMFGGCA